MKHPRSSLSLAAACAVLLGTSAAFAQSNTSSAGSNTYPRQGTSSSSRDSSSSSSRDSTYQGATSTDSSRHGTTASGGYDSTASGSTHQTQTAATNTHDRSMSSGRLGFMDRRFVSKAADEGKAEVELAKLAAERATNPEVKSYAQKLVDDHSKVNEELTSLASQKNVKLDDDDDQDRSYKRLSRKSGADFDQEFVEHMIDAHEKDIKMFEKAAKDAKDSDIRGFASKHVDHLREHLRMAEGLRTSTMPTGRDEGTSGRARSGSAQSTDTSTSTNASGTTSSGTTSGSTDNTSAGSTSTPPSSSSTNSSADQKRGGSR